MGNIKIKKATLEDFDYIIEGIYNLRLHEKQFFEKLNPEGVFDKKFKLEIKGKINSEKSFIRILIENGEYAGIIIGEVTSHFSVWNYNLYSELEYLFIEKKFRQKGYAEILCNNFFNWAKEKGSDRMVLSGMIGNQGAYNLYKKLGFTESIFMMGKNLK